MSHPVNDGLLDDLIDEYREFMEENNLPPCSADELLHEDLTDDQRDWVETFINRWEEISER